MKRYPSLKNLDVIPCAGVGRRIARDLDSGKIIEDLWIGRSTPKKVMSCEIAKTCNIGIQIEMNSIDGTTEEAPWEERLMSPHEATRFRGTAARINFLAADRPDLQYASKETSPRMANPQNQDWELDRKSVGRERVLVAV